MPKAASAPAVPTLARRLVLRLKTKHLLLLLAIREHRSLTRVAERLSTSQPAVTQSLADLEGLFGAALFIRSPRGMEPTALGELVIARARTLLADIEPWASDIEAVAAGRAAHLHVGVIPFLPGRLLAHAIARTQPDGRRITVTLHEDTSDHLLARLRDHETAAALAGAGRAGLGPRRARHADARADHRLLSSGGRASAAALCRESVVQGDRRAGGGQ